MRILLLTTHMNTGGITSYVLTLTRGLVGRGHEVYILSSGGDKEAAFQACGATIKRINIQTKSELSPRIFLSLPSLCRYLKKHKIDVIHSQTRVTQVLALMLKHLTGRPSVTTCHGFFKARFGRKLVPAWGDAAIAISSAVHAHLCKDFRVPQRKICLIRSGIDLNPFLAGDKGQRDKIRHHWGVGTEPVIGMVARLSSVKGQDILIDAMSLVVKEFPTCRLILFGEGKTESDLKQQAEKKKLSSQVIFKRDAGDMAQTLFGLDIFVMPSREEGLGLSLMDAQAAGLPVVAAAVGGIVDLIEDGQTGILVPKENPQTLAQALLLLLKDRDLARSLGAAAREKALREYSDQEMVEKVEGVYRRLCKTF
ncbi:MAG: glycosyltransferase family 4 protein [Candidatus Omnitrophica bacterium]|nr:glycosyltransferase family 4 protein [Candidatus Omnitrophota bacterium]